jgi:hypothetical protein
MDEEKTRKLDELTLSIDMDLNILHNALKYNDKALEMSSVSYFVENIYKKSCEIRNLF